MPFAGTLELIPASIPALFVACNGLMRPIPAHNYLYFIDIFSTSGLLWTNPVQGISYRSLAACSAPLTHSTSVEGSEYVHDTLHISGINIKVRNESGTWPDNSNNAVPFQIRL